MSFVTCNGKRRVEKRELTILKMKKCQSIPNEVGSGLRDAVDDTVSIESFNTNRRVEG